MVIAIFDPQSAKYQAPAFAEAPALRKASGGGASRRQAKLQINLITKISNSKRFHFGHSSFGDWDLFVIWDLEIGILPPKFS